jgi:hypothetical protein
LQYFSNLLCVPGDRATRIESEKLLLATPIEPLKGKIMTWGQRHLSDQDQLVDGFETLVDRKILRRMGLQISSQGCGLPARA